jgi:hypothetical protein
MLQGKNPMVRMDLAAAAAIFALHASAASCDLVFPLAAHAEEVLFGYANIP